MNKQKDDKWLDEQICRAINTTKPQFDSEKWKQKYHKEFQMLVSRAEKTPPAQPVPPAQSVRRAGLRSTAKGESVRRAGSTTKVRLSDILKNPITKLTVAALIILAIGFFMIHLGPGEKVDTSEAAQLTKSSAEMLTALSLECAFRRGGIEAVYRQCEKAIEMLGPRPAEITIEKTLTEFDGI